MRQYLLTVIRLVPDPLRGEFINVGIGLREKDGVQYRVYVPPRLSSTKVKSWFPELDHYTLSHFLKYYAENVAKALSSNELKEMQNAFEEILARDAYNVFKATPLEIVQGADDFDNEFEFWKNQLLDLREKRYRIAGKSEVKTRLERTFRRFRLLGTKVRAAEKPFYDRDGLIPVYADYEWKNGKTGLIKVVTYAEEGASEQALTNRWTQIKATIQEAVAAEEAGYDYTVITPADPVGEGKKMEQALKRALDASRIYDTNHLDELANRIGREGIELTEI